MTSSIELNESEIHILRLAINTARAEWDDYLIRRNDDPAATQALKKRALLLKHLALRFEDLAPL